MSLDSESEDTKREDETDEMITESLCYSPRLLNKLKYKLTIRTLGKGMENCRIKKENKKSTISINEIKS